MDKYKSQLPVLVRVIAALGVFLISNTALAKNPFVAAAESGESGDKTSVSMTDIKAKDIKAVELQADQVQYSAADNKALAKGNVVVTAGPTILTCDELELDRVLQEGKAQGHVYIDSPQAQVDADEGIYNFNDQSGSFKNARIYQFPYQMGGKEVDRLSPEHIAMRNGYMTTSDHDDPFFKLGVTKMDVYPGDKAVARGIKVYLGGVPVAYWPKFTQNLKDKPWITFIPGRSKDFGAFLLTTIRQRVGDSGKLTVHVDVRERKGIAYGLDYKYDTRRYGSGILKTYYTHERSLEAKHPWQDKPIVKTQRYKIEWRHKWTPDKNTDILMQYYRVSDRTFIKEYFERQYRADPTTNTYFLLTRNLPKGTLTFNIEASRVNHYARGVEKLPEVKYELSDTQIGSTGFYAQTTDTFSNLVRKSPGTDAYTADSQKTMRFDTRNRISYPMKVSFVELRPFAGGQNTYYSRTADLSRRNVIRGVFFTGADASTKFYKTWAVKKNIWGMELNGLRHVVTPTAAYLYQHDPTIPSSKLNSFDAIDSVTRAHVIGLGLENKLQTKQKGVSVDLLRTLVSSDFALKENPSRGGFGPVKGDVEFKPASWLSFNGDTEYDHYNDHLTSANFDTFINGGEKWNFGIGRRYARDADDQITAEWNYKINAKWRFKVYERFLISNGGLKEEDYVLTRDLHDWAVNMEYHQERGGGSDILLSFTLKAFPDMGLDLFSTSYNRRKAGSQSSTTP